MKLCWLDLRGCGAMADAIRGEAVHQGIDGIVAADPTDLAGLPPTVTRVLMPPDDVSPDALSPDALAGGQPGGLDGVDAVILDPARYREVAGRSAAGTGVRYGRYVEVTDADSLDLACRVARTDPWCVLRFADPTRIPLEIVLAAADGAEGRVITVVDDPADAGVVFGVLERGSDGVLMAPRTIGDATRLRAAAAPRTEDLKLVELAVTGIDHLGMGDRACVDTCAYLGGDEGILVGSRARGMLLCASETHPLPYMPTRPFRVNAGAVMSYTLAGAGRTRYLSELRAGARVLAVDVHGRTRPVIVGRIKVETRPLLSIDATAPDGRAVNVIVQDDWHVRLLGPDGAVLNSTALRPGDRVLGYLPDRDRHVGYPIDERCHEQ